ncbi:MAG: metallophosphoesterase [archaeon]
MNHSIIFILIYIVIIITYFIASTYAFNRLKHYFSLKYKLKSFVISLILSLLIPIGIIIQETIDTGFTTFIYNGAFLIFIFVLALIVFTIVLDIIKLIFKDKVKNYVWGIIILSITILFTLVSFINAINYKEINVDIYTSKINQDTRIVQISDVHLFGVASENRFNKIYTSIISLNPDLIVITGDLFDTPGTIPTNAINIINDYNIPVYFAYGNHDIMYGEEKSKEIIDNTHMIALNNEKIINKEKNISIIGIKYARDVETIGKVLQKIDVDKNEYNILLYHEPVGTKDAVNKGIDLMLSGHTHGGQVFPLTALIGLMYDYVKGEYLLDNMTLYVNQGTGLWGPKMRLSTRSEITVFNIKKE